MGEPQEQVREFMRERRQEERDVVLTRGKLVKQLLFIEGIILSIHKAAAASEAAASICSQE